LNELKPHEGYFQHL